MERSATFRSMSRRSEASPEPRRPEEAECPDAPEKCPREELPETQPVLLTQVSCACTCGRGEDDDWTPTERELFPPSLSPGATEANYELVVIGLTENVGPEDVYPPHKEEE